MRGEDIDAAVTGSREGLDAAEKGNSNRSGSGVSLMQTEIKSSEATAVRNFFDAQAKVQHVVDKCMDKSKSQTLDV